jgi:adenosylcobinamide-GDP ribazoletransferase
MFFPVVGLLLGLASGGVALLLRDRLGLPAHLLWALLLVALHAFLTGALHLDGLSDIVDGLGGSRGDRERALEIMKDPRAGAFGVVALILLLAGKIIVLNEALRMPQSFAILAVYPVVARFAAALLVVFFPCARATGMARTFHDESRWPFAIVAAAFTVGAFWYFAPMLAVPAACALGTGLAVGGWITVRLRGLTGDAYGAAIELSELAFLAVAAWPRIRGG